MQQEIIIGWLATDSDGFQNIFKREPKRKIYKKGIMQDNIAEKGEWISRKGYDKEIGLHHILIGRRMLNHTWFNDPIKATIKIEIGEDKE